MLKYILALIVTLCLTAPARSQVAVAVGGGWGGVAGEGGSPYRADGPTNPRSYKASSAHWQV
jgi:hypothetical protein